MTIILFVVDTSASLNQRSFHGMSLVDVASKAINDFVQQRKRDQSSRGDRYMLMTFEESPFHLKAGWKENQETFDNSLKTIAANQLNDVGSALQNAFTMLNVNKLQAGKETYGSGRIPSLLDPTVIILISDGVSFQAGAQQQQTLDTNALMSQITREVALFRHDGGAGAVPAQPTLANIKLEIPGGSLTDAPYRWDQRLFSWILHFPGRQSAVSTAAAGSNVTSQNFAGFMPSSTMPIPAARDASSVLDRYAAETGGRSFLIDNFATLQSVIAYTCQKVVPGVVVEFQVADRSTADEIVRATKAAANASSIMETPVTPRPSVTKSPASGGESENNDLLYSPRPPQIANTVADADILPASTRTAAEAVVPSAVDLALAELDAVMLELKDGLKQMLIVKRETANKTPLIQAMWPIPENFPLEDGYQQTLPTRPVHPQFELLFDIDQTVKVPQSSVQNNISFAVDRFDLEPSTFCDCLLRISAVYKDCSWPISISVRSKLARAAASRSNTPNNNAGSIPCGYLKASSPAVMSLYLLPAHYEKLFRLLDTYKNLQKPTSLFRDELFSYVSSIPFYVREALQKYGFRGFDTTQTLAQLLQESIHASPPSGLSHALTQRLRKDRLDAKREHDELVVRGVVLRAHDATVPIMPRDTGTFESQTQDVWHIWKDIIEVRGMQQGFEQLERMRTVFQDLLKRQAIRIAARRPPAASFQSVPDNPFDVERDQLLLGLRKSRRALMDGPGKQTWFAESADDVDDARHSMPSSVMSNFVEFKKTLPLMPELRELNVAGERTQSFGNPWKNKQRDSNANALGAFVDEMMIDIDLMPNGGAEGLALTGGGGGSMMNNTSAAFNKHQHSKSKKSSLLSRSGGSRNSGKHRGVSAAAGIGGAGIGAFMNRVRGPLPRSFSWAPSAERRKRSASVSEFGDFGGGLSSSPLSPALSLPDLTFTSTFAVDNSSSLSAPSSPMLLSLLSPVPSPSHSMSPTYSVDEQNFDADGDYNMLSSSDNAKSTDDTNANADDSTAVQASYAALVQHQEHLRMTKEKLNNSKQDSPSASPSYQSNATSDTTADHHHTPTNELLESVVSRSRTRGEYEFRRSSWHYGASLFDAKQKLRQFIRNASAHQQSQNVSSSTTTSESEMAPIADVFEQYAQDDEIHLHLIVDCFNEALRFHLLALAHHIYDYFLLQNFESRMGSSTSANSDELSAHRESVQVVAATACLLQHYVPKPHAQLMNRFRSQTSHLLPLSSAIISDAVDDEDSSMPLAHKTTSSLPQLVLADESRKLLKAAVADSTSSSTSNVPAALAQIRRRCLATDLIGNIQQLMQSSSEDAADDSMQHQRHVFAQKLQFVRKNDAEHAAIKPKTENASAKNELRALYERANQRDNVHSATAAIRPAVHAAVEEKKASIINEPPAARADDGLNVKSEALSVVSPSSMVNGAMNTHTSPNSMKRHASLNDDEEQKRIALKMRYQKDMLGVTLTPSAAADAESNHHHRARASTISTVHHNHASAHESNMLSTIANGIISHKNQQMPSRNAAGELKPKLENDSSRSGDGRGLR